MFGHSKKSPPRIDTLIGRSARVHGDMSFAGGLHVDGVIAGSVRAEPGVTASVSVSEHGHIEGSVEAPTVVLNGIVNGDIIAAGRIVLGAKARVQGDVYYGAIEMALGAEINGKLVPSQASAEAASGTVAAQPIDATA
jgi:cytoskeletal protein CcmA (bactofilin family)